jgi:hypothetical protein
MDQVSIYNLALDSIGSRSTVSSPSEQSPEAFALNRHWQPAIEKILQTARWNFARKQVQLTLLNDATQGQPVPTPWMYEYAVPNDCTQARYIMPAIYAQNTSQVVGAPATPITTGPPVRFLISTDNDPSGNQIAVILTNQIQAQLVYTSRVLNPALFDGQFVDALYNYLGARVCIALSGDKQMMGEAFKRASALCDAAAASNGNESITVIDQMPDWIRVRGYASDWAYPDGGMFLYGTQALSMVN